MADCVIFEITCKTLACERHARSIKLPASVRFPLDSTVFYADGKRGHDNDGTSDAAGGDIFMRGSIQARREDVTQNVQPLTIGILRKLPSLN
jgi:hypothetical protein